MAGGTVVKLPMIMRQATIGMGNDSWNGLHTDLIRTVMPSLPTSILMLDDLRGCEESIIRLPMAGLSLAKS
jgi:hypothetical protein